MFTDHNPIYNGILRSKMENRHEISNVSNSFIKLFCRSVSLAFALQQVRSVLAFQQCCAMPSAFFCRCFLEWRVAQCLAMDSDGEGTTTGDALAQESPSPSGDHEHEPAALQRSPDVHTSASATSEGLMYLLYWYTLPTSCRCMVQVIFYSLMGTFQETTGSPQNYYPYFLKTFILRFACNRNRGI